jgi:rhomboid protease GluP
MAVGISPKHIQDYPLDNLTSQQFLTLAIEAAKKLDWNIGATSEGGFMAYTKFSMSSWSEEVEVRMNDTTVTLQSQCTGNQIVDWGKNKKNIEELIVIIEELKNSFSPDELSQKFEALKSEPVSLTKELPHESPLTAREKVSDFFSIFKPTEGYFITPILIVLNIAIFAAMVISGVDFMAPDNESLLKWGANFRPITLEGQWWRLVTCNFLHIGIIHLLMNMYALLYIGTLLEPYLGKARFIAAYLLTGLTASLVSLWWHDLTISAGASGAIFGMYGVFLAMLTTNLIEKSGRQSLLTSIGIFVAYNLINGIRGGIDNAAHIGGLLGGLIVGYAYLPSLKNNSASKLKQSTIAILSVAIIAMAFIVYKILPNDIGKYDAKMQEFVSMEAKALEIYNIPKDTPKEKILIAIRDTGIINWNKSIKMLTELDKLNLPDDIHQRNKKLLEYCNIRLKSYELIYKAIDQDTDQYQEQIENYTKEIEKVVSDLNAKSGK